jgi:hypothetical protein
MATLPESTTNIYQVGFVSEPSLTWNIDKNTNQISGQVDGINAVRQAVEIIMNVERFRWQIYEPYSGIETVDLLGNDAGYISSEFQRRVRDALTVDDRITGISNYTSTVSGNTMEVSFTVNTVYGDIPVETEVSLQ